MVVVYSVEPTTVPVWFVSWRAVILKTLRLTSVAKYRCAPQKRHSTVGCEGGVISVVKISVQNLSENGFWQLGKK